MGYTKAEIARDRRNLNPTAEAVLAMNIWSEEYAFKQRGGSMDFWDSLTDARKELCRELARRVREADKAHGVSPQETHMDRPVGTWCYEVLGDGWFDLYQQCETGAFCIGKINNEATVQFIVERLNMPPVSNGE